MSATCDDKERCYLAALRILQYRFNSDGELRRKLRSKQYDPATIDATLARLHEEKWLDDERFAGAFVRTRTRKSIGAKRIRRELQVAGVDQDVASRALSENVSEEAEREQLLAAGRKRARLLDRRHGEGYAASSEGRNKLAAYLLKQGYEAALVYAALKEIAVADHQPDS